MAGHELNPNRDVKAALHNPVDKQDPAKTKSWLSTTNKNLLFSIFLSSEGIEKSPDCGKVL
jgi:hypothetical protein